MSRGSGILAAAVVLGVGMSLLAGCTQQTVSGPSVNLSQGFSAYESRDFSQATQIAREYISANPNGSQLDDAYYLLGISHETQGQFHRARHDFQRAIALTQRDTLKEKANKALGDMAFAKGHYGQAASYYQIAINSMNGATPPASMLFKYGAALQDSGHWNQARSPLAQAVSDAPGTTAASNAEQRLEADHFAIQYGAFLISGAAWQVVGQLRSAGVAAVVVPSVVGGRTLYLVQSGQYNTLAAALAARAVASHQYPQVIVVP
ncbi:MAG: tetratricopeptide repeat protein [Phycisphaerae bacterium]